MTLSTAAAAFVYPDNWRIALVYDAAVDFNRYTRETMIVISGFREDTDDAYEWIADELCFWNDLRVRNVERSAGYVGYFLQVFNGYYWRGVKPIEAVPHPVDFIDDEQEFEDYVFDAACKGPCRQLVDTCICDDLVSRTRMTPVRRRQLAFSR